MKVLSIDFDYFQDVSKDTLKMYPVGIDNTTGASEKIWSVRYSDKTISEALRKVTIRQDELQAAKELFLHQRSDIPVMIANSHRHIYDFIHDNAAIGTKMAVVNVDMHHDVYNNNPKVDCGNWLNFIHKEYNANYLWICNPVSKSVYGFTEENLPPESKKGELAKLLPESLDVLKENGMTNFDMVFLCRSDIWTPPHLDRYFTELCGTAKSHFNEILFEDGITRPRNYPKMCDKKRFEMPFQNT